MFKNLFMAFVIVPIVSLYATLQAATFNVTTPTNFQEALTTAQSNGESETMPSDVYVYVH